jgi:dimethylhistidine N-methyltransferase
VRSDPRATALNAFIDLEPKTGDFRREVLSGLNARQKRIPSKFFYDETGSRLFERICTLEEYYPTRTEIAILTENAGVLGALLPAGASVIEFGSGSIQKIRLLLRALRQPQCYVPIDISRDHLLDNAKIFAQEQPTLDVNAVCADFTHTVALDHVVPAGPRIGFFPGSTIGNFAPDEAVEFLRDAATTLGSGGYLVIGVDLKKERSILEAAYNDAQGVTAAFNLNLLRRINRELGGTFELRDFKHRAFYRPDQGRIEMHLVSQRRQQVSVGGAPFGFSAGETIHTENSYKHTVDGFRELASEAGFRSALTLTDPRNRFSVHCLQAA